MNAYRPTPRTEFHRMPARGTYDRATVHAILDEALVAHVGFVSDGQPFVIPTVFVRRGEALLIHGAVASRMLKAVAGTGGGASPGAARACVNVTIVDGLVLARSAFHHSMNYRSVVVLGAARVVDGTEEKRAALACLVEKISAGRMAQVRGPNVKELTATTVLEVAIEEASAKVRTGPPVEEPEDLDVPVWAGVVPLALRAGVPEPHAPCLVDEPARVAF